MGLDEKGEYRAGTHILQMNRIHEELLNEYLEVDRDISYLEQLRLQVELIKVTRNFFAKFLNITPDQINKLSYRLRHWVTHKALYKLFTGIERFKANIERPQPESRNLEKETLHLDEVSNAINRVISRLTEYEDQDEFVDVLAIEAPKPRLFLEIEAGDGLMLGKNEKEREAKHKDPVVQLREGKDLATVLPPPPAFLNAKGQLWQNPILKPDGTTIDADEMPKKTGTVKQSILDLNLKRAMQQYRGFRDELEQLQQGFLEKKKRYDQLKTRLGDVDTDFIEAVTFDLFEQAEDLTQITECVAAHDFFSFSAIEPDKNQELIRLIELEEKHAKILAQKADLEKKHKESFNQKNAVSKKISSLRDDIQGMLETIELSWSETDEEFEAQPPGSSSNTDESRAIEKNQLLRKMQSKLQVKDFERGVIEDTAELKVQEEAEKAHIKEIAKLEKMLAALEQEERQLKAAINAIYARLDALEQTPEPDTEMKIVRIENGKDEKEPFVKVIEGEETKLSEPLASAPMALSVPQDESDATAAMAVGNAVDTTKKSSSAKGDDQKEEKANPLQAVAKEEQKSERSQTLLEKVAACSSFAFRQDELRLKVENTLSDLATLLIRADAGQIKPAQIWAEFSIGPAIRDRGDNIVTAALKTNHPKILSYCLALLKYAGFNKRQYRELLLSGSPLNLTLQIPEMLNLYVQQLIYSHSKGIITSDDIFALFQSRVDHDDNSSFLNALRLSDPRQKSASRKRKHRELFMYDTCAEWFLEQLKKLHEAKCFSSDKIIAILNHANKLGYTALHVICNYNHEFLFRRFIELVEQVSYKPNKFGALEFDESYFYEQVTRLTNNHLVGKPKAIPNVPEMFSCINTYLTRYRKGSVDYSFRSRQILREEADERTKKKHRDDKDESASHRYKSYQKDQEDQDSSMAQDIAYTQSSKFTNTASVWADPHQERKADSMDVREDHSDHFLAQAPWKKTGISTAKSFANSHAGIYRQSHEASRLRPLSIRSRVVTSQPLHLDGDFDKYGIAEADFTQVFQYRGNSLA